MTYEQLRRALQEAMEDYKKTADYRRVENELRYVSLTDMATDVTPFLWKYIEQLGEQT